MALLASEILAVTGQSPSQRYAELTEKYGAPTYARIDAPANREQKARLAKLSAEQQKTEKAMQRGWIKGRNECWKESDSRQCVEESYQLRITELQIKGGQLMVPSPVDYQCDGEIRLSTYFYNEAKRPAAVINLSEGAQQSQVLAFEAPSASGARYEGQNLTLLTKGNEARLERYDQPPRQCRVSGQ